MGLAEWMGFAISEMKYGIWQIWKQNASEMAKGKRVGGIKNENNIQFQSFWVFC